MNLMTRNFLILAIGLVMGFTLSVGGNVLAERAASTALPLEELRTFSEIFAKLKADYVEDVDDRELVENAIRGMLSGLDPHSSYLNQEEFKELQVGTTGEFGGLGIEVGMSEDGFVKVVSPIDDTPAQRAGVEAGDLIVRLDDTPVKGMTLNEAVKIMRGKPGTDIDLTIVREGEAKPLKITITRDIIKVKSVKFRTLEKGFGYVRITSFQTRTADDLNRAISELREENGGSLTGLVLDLRNNPGGVLSAAVAVSDAFLDKGLIVYTAGRAQDSELRFNATPKDLIDGAPIVVLINGGSASASEIVSGALQDHKRAIIMGDTSFGKGSVQTIFPMSNNTAVKFTTARYYTPSGRSIQAEGIVPDIQLEPLKLTEAERSAVSAVKERDLNGHLESADEQKSGEASAEEQSQKKADEEKQALAKDYPLYQALTLLKGLQILQNR